MIASPAGDTSQRKKGFSLQRATAGSDPVITKLTPA